MKISVCITGGWAKVMVNEIYKRWQSAFLQNGDLILRWIVRPFVTLCWANSVCGGGVDHMLAFKCGGSDHPRVGGSW
jgi:hypothetical protein